ncbi:glycoside hydrolase family 48 protein [Bacillus licheniformis]|nr:glycoside hydrolase family 48 protein [Bacillus licheniformis]
MPAAPRTAGTATTAHIRRMSAHLRNGLHRSACISRSPSNNWFGMQVWPLERVAELYYISQRKVTNRLKTSTWQSM